MEQTRGLDGGDKAGGVDLPGELAGVIALDEIVVRGWDVARSSSQPYDVEPDLLEAVHGFVAPLAEQTHRCRGRGCSARPSRYPPTPRCSTASSASPAASLHGHHADHYSVRRPH